MNTLHLTSREGRPVTARRETGKHGGPVLVIRDEQTATVLLGVKVEHATVPVLSTVLPASAIGSIARALLV